MELDVCACDERNWRVIVLVDSAKTLLPLHVWVVWVAGLHHHPAAQGDTVAPGNQLLIVPEPDNPVDVDATAVCDADGERIAYIPSYYNAKLTRIQRYGLSLLEQVEDDRCTGLLIAVSREPIQPHLVSLDRAALGLILAHLPKVPKFPEHSPSTPLDPVAGMWEMLRDQGLQTP